jgi:excisionase family DNA binding protein
MNRILDEVNELVRKAIMSVHPDDEKFLTSAESAELLKVNRKWLNMQAKAGALPYYRIGNGIKYKRLDLLRFAEKFRVLRRAV